MSFYASTSQSQVQTGLNIREILKGFHAAETAEKPRPVRQPRPEAQLPSTGDPKADYIATAFASVNKFPVAASSEFNTDAAATPIESALVYRFIAPNSPTHHDFIAITTSDAIDVDSIPINIRRAAFSIASISAGENRQARTDILFRIDSRSFDGISEGRIAVAGKNGRETTASKALFWTAAALTYRLNKKTGTRWRIIQHQQTMPKGQRWRALTLNPTAFGVALKHHAPVVNTLNDLKEACAAGAFQQAIGYNWKDSHEKPHLRQRIGSRLANTRKQIKSESIAQEISRLRQHGITAEGCSTLLDISSRQVKRLSSSWKKTGVTFPCSLYSTYVRSVRTDLNVRVKKHGNVTLAEKKISPPEPAPINTAERYNPSHRTRFSDINTAERKQDSFSGEFYERINNTADPNTADNKVSAVINNADHQARTGLDL